MLSLSESRRLKASVDVNNQRMAEIFDTLGDANRCQLFRLMTKSPGLNVTEAAAIVGLSLPLASQHLKILDRSGLLIKTKKGREVYYRLNKRDAMVAAIVKAIKS